MGTDRLKLLVCGLLVLVIAGCDPAPKDASKPNTTVETPTKEPSKPTEANKPADSTTPATNKEVSLAQLPQDLKTDAFEYYGLGSAKDVPLEMTDSVNKEAKTGARKVTFTGEKDGKATFTVEHTGNLSALGTLNMSLEKDGLFTESTSLGKSSPHSLEVPTKLAPGVTWSSAEDIESDSGGKFSYKGAYRVVKEETVKTKGGDFKALYIESTGPVVQNGESKKMFTKMWLAKGVGLVKQELTLTDAKGAKVTIQTQVTK